MKRHEAVSCLKEIQHTCFSLSPDSVSLVNSKLDDNLSVGYQRHIQAVLDKYTKRQINGVAERLRLEILEEPGKIVIYKPKPVLS